MPGERSEFAPNPSEEPKLPTQVFAKAKGIEHPDAWKGVNQFATKLEDPQVGGDVPVNTMTREELIEATQEIEARSEALAAQGLNLRLSPEVKAEMEQNRAIDEKRRQDLHDRSAENLMVTGTYIRDAELEQQQQESALNERKARMQELYRIAGAGIAEVSKAQAEQDAAWEARPEFDAKLDAPEKRLEADDVDENKAA